MYIFRWLMKHPIIILALYFLSIAAILFNMTSGSSVDKQAEKVDVALEQTTKSQEVDLSNAPAIEPSTLTSALVTGEPTEASTATEKPSEQEATTEEIKTEENSAVENTKAEVADENSNAKVETTETEISSAASYFEKHGVDSSLNAPVAVVDEVETSTGTENQETEVETQFSEMSNDELLVMAREAYWNNGLEESAQIYQQLISSNPDVIDYKGELGNVFWRQGFPKKAAELYAEISLPLIEQGNIEKVANMVGFIGLYYPEKAAEIHEKLQSVQ